MQAVTLGKLAVLAGEKHGDGAVLRRCVAPSGVQGREGARRGVRHLDQRRPLLWRGHSAAPCLCERGELDAAFRLGAGARAGVLAHARAAAPELGLPQLAVHHALHHDEEHAHEQRECGNRGVGARVPSL